MYYTYMLRCEDNSLYTGITTDIKRRMKEHFNRNDKCAKYTFTHQAKILEAVWESDNRAAASKLEYHIKRLTKKQKEELIIVGDLKNLLGEKIDVEQYKRVEVEKV